MAEITLDEGELQTLLNISFNVSDQLLNLSVDQDEGLVEGDNASTWIAYNRFNDDTPDRISWLMEDDDGESELEYFPANIDGLRKALERHSERQDVYGDKDYNTFLKKFLKTNVENHLKTIPEKKIKEYVQELIPLKGEELLKKLSEIGDVSAPKKAIECHYFIQSSDGSKKPRLMDFYAALLEAKELFPRN